MLMPHVIFVSVVVHVCSIKLPRNTVSTFFMLVEALLMDKKGQCLEVIFNVSNSRWLGGGGHSVAIGL